LKRKRPPAISSLLRQAKRNLLAGRGGLLEYTGLWKDGAPRKHLDRGGGGVEEKIQKEEETVSPN